MMKNVRKEFLSNGKRRLAVEELTLTLYEDQITAFLGHNGAGNDPSTLYFFLFSHLSCVFSTT